MKTIDAPQIELVAACLDCRCKHSVRVPAIGNDFLREMDEWRQKHLGHEIEFWSPKRLIPKDLDDSGFDTSPWWLDFDGFKENANIKLAYASASALTITLASLASDTNLLAGRASTAVDNTSNLYLDYGIAGFITVGSSPTASEQISVFAYAALDDTPNYPDGITGTDANKTISNTGVLNAGLPQVVAISTASTSSVKYPFGPVSLSYLFGGFCPSHWGIFVVHNTGVNLDSTGSNHEVVGKGAYATSI